MFVKGHSLMQDLPYCTDGRKYQSVHNGKCDVKYGDYETISTMKEKLQNAGLSVTMDVNG